MGEKTQSRLVIILIRIVCQGRGKFNLAFCIEAQLMVARLPIKSEYEVYLYYNTCLLSLI